MEKISVSSEKKIDRYDAIQVLTIMRFKSGILPLEELAIDAAIDALFDYVPQTRCGECIYWKKDAPGCTEYVGRCELANYMVGTGGYCTYASAEPKEKGEKRDELRH